MTGSAAGAGFWGLTLGSAEGWITAAGDPGITAVMCAGRTSGSCERVGGDTPKPS
jgi:hypothetical protein